MADDSDVEKSEQPTESKINKAKEKGQIPRSRELTSMLMLFVGIAMLWMTGSSIGENLTQLMQQSMAIRTRLGDDKQMLINFVSLIKFGFAAIMPLLAALIITALVAPLLIGGLLFSGQSLKPDLKRLNPISGLGRMFSSKIFAELLKGMLKVLLILIITGWFLMTYFPTLLSLPGMYVHSAFSGAMQLVVYCGLLVTLSLMPMVSFDIFYQIWSNLKKLRMSKQEIKDEFKEQEGDPQLKARIRQTQQSLARRRMMSDVARADVIITNPTHYAIALQYNETTMRAPKVLAKGTELIALRIRELAKEHHILQLEAPPLARALYRHCHVGETIPAEFYAAIAQVLAWVYQTRRWHRQGGVAPVKPTSLTVPDLLDSSDNKGDSQPHE